MCTLTPIILQLKCSYLKIDKHGKFSGTNVFEGAEIQARDDVSRHGQREVLSPSESRESVMWSQYVDPMRRSVATMGT